MALRGRPNDYFLCSPMNFCEFFVADLALQNGGFFFVNFQWSRFRLFPRKIRSISERKIQDENSTNNFPDLTNVYKEERGHVQQTWCESYAQLLVQWRV